MTDVCSRCGRSQPSEEIPVRTVVIPFLLAMTRKRPVAVETGWVELTTSSGIVVLCPQCAAHPGLPNSSGDEARAS